MSTVPSPTPYDVRFSHNACVTDRQTTDEHHTKLLTVSMVGEIIFSQRFCITIQVVSSRTVSEEVRLDFRLSMNNTEACSVSCAVDSRFFTACFVLSIQRFRRHPEVGRWSSDNRQRYGRPTLETAGFLVTLADVGIIRLSAVGAADQRVCCADKCTLLSLFFCQMNCRSKMQNFGPRNLTLLVVPMSLGTQLSPPPPQEASSFTLRVASLVSCAAAIGRRLQRKERV